MTSAKAAPPPVPVPMARILALQPKLRPTDLEDAVVSTEDPLLLETVCNLVRIWATARKDLPADFSERVQVKALSRQPLSFASIDMETVERDAMQVNEPFPPGSGVDASPWPTNDLFMLRPLSPPTFPPAPQRTRVDLPGRQSVGVCTSCQGAGAENCVTCAASGRQICGSCSGTRQVTCPQCGGGGTHIGVSGRYIQCRRCNTRGTIQCQNCRATGQVTCQVCAGRGTLQCEVCSGYGNLKSRWVLNVNTETAHEHEFSLADPWPAPTEQLLSDTEVLSEVIVRPADGDATISAVAPASLRSMARRVLEKVSSSASGEQRIAAYRVQIRGTYLYDVRLEYSGRPVTVLIGGIRSQVFPKSALPAKSGTLQTLGRFFQRGLRALATDERPGVGSDFVKAVAVGSAHLTDTNCLLPAVAAHLRCPCSVTGEGYVLQVVEDTSKGSIPGPPIPINIKLDSEVAGKLTLCASVIIGDAHRDQFPLALSLNSKLMVGRLAVAEIDGVETYIYVDRRPYDFANAGRYAAALQGIAAAVRWFNSSKSLK